jgi:CRP/FNR family cyclic AMP-dependent transcriptional regulator
LILSSLKGLPVARTIETLFEYEPFLVQVWRNGLFLETGYSLENLERELESADFGIVIANAADAMAANDPSSTPPRDSAVFELGLLIGKLGRHRTLLLEPGDKDADLSPNASSVATLSYPRPGASHLLTAMRPTYDQLSEHIKQFGPRN